MVIQNENQEINEIAKNRKTNIIKRKIREGRKNSKKKEKTLQQTNETRRKNKKRIRNGKDGKNIDM